MAWRVSVWEAGLYLNLFQNTFEIKSILAFGPHAGALPARKNQTRYNRTIVLF
jgi:hypothetical protein